MNCSRLRTTLLPIFAALAVTACGTMHYDPRTSSATTAATMSAETAERVVRSTLARSYPITHRGARFTAIELSPEQFRVVVFEKGEAKESKECIFKFGTQQPLRVWAQETSYFVQLFEDRCGIHWHDITEAKAFADALGRLETLAVTGKLTAQKSAAADFKKIAADYRAANPKPALSEEAHKYQVIAENAFDEKRYADALEYFERALRIAPWWASGHYNRALLLAREKNLEDAVLEMKMYLELTPDAKDARAARDKMYIWEGKVEKAGGGMDAALESAPSPAAQSGISGAMSEAIAPRK